ncbi:MAG: ATP-binding protein [Actinomadura sp.]
MRAVPEAVAEARSLVEATLVSWAFHHLIPDAKLIVSELASNSIPAAPGAEIWLLFTHERDAVWLCVWDPSPVLPEVRVCAPDAESGRGLRIVAAVSDDNGAFQVSTPKGKITWARLNTRPSPPTSTDHPEEHA